MTISSGVEGQARRPARIARGGWQDVLRFAAGSLIILYHFREASPVPLPQLHPVFDRGYLLTDFFIIDSGYVLARIYGDRLAARLIREHPLGDLVRQVVRALAAGHVGDVDAPTVEAVLAEVRDGA